MNTAAPTNTSTTNKHPVAKQELIPANVKRLIEHLETGHSEALTNYLTAMRSRFHSYSFGNVLDIARQMPNATAWRFGTWENLSRSVNTGAKGVRILAPIVGAHRKKD